MSDDDGQEPPPKRRRRVKRGWWWRWPGTAVILVVEGSILFVAVGGSALAWRAAQGPVDLSWLLPKIGRVIAVAQPDLDVGIERLAIAWAGFTKGPDQPVQLVADGLHVDDAAQGRHVAVDHLAVDLSAAWAVRGVAVPRRVTVVNPRIVLQRTAPKAAQEARPVIEHQSFSVSDIIRVLAEPPATDAQLVEVKPQALAQLRRLIVTGGELTLRAAPEAQGVSATALRAETLNLDLTRAEVGGLTGHYETVLSALSGEAEPKTPSATLAGSVALATDGTTRVQGKATVADPVRLMAAIGADASTPVPAFPLTADADVTVTPDLVPTALAATLHGGAGQLLFNGARIPVTSALLALTGDPSHILLDPKSQIVFGAVSNQPPPMIGLGGEVHRASPGYVGALSLKIDHVASTDLPAYWPPGLANGGRTWIAAQIKDGSAHDGAFQFGLTATPDLSNVALTSATGQVLATGLTVTWLPPIPPMTKVNGAIALQGPDQIKITVDQAQQGAMSVSNSSLVISALSAPIQPAAVTVNLSGAVSDALALVNHPRLHLLTGVPVPLNATAGTFTTKIQIGLPLKNIVLASDVTVGVHADLKGVTLAKILVGKDLTNAAITIDATAQKLHLVGQGNLAAIPTQQTLDADFTAGPPDQVQVRLQATASANPAALAAAGIPTGGVLHGTAQLAVAVTARRNGRTDVDATATLPLGDLSVASIGWRGGAGDAHAAAHVALQGPRIVAIDKISLSGAGTQLQASSAVTGGQLSSVTVDRLVLGRTNLRGKVVFPTSANAPYVFDVSGAALDLSTPFKGAKPTTTSVAGTNQALDSISSKKTFQRHTPWRGTVNVDRIIFGTTPQGVSRELDRVRGTAADDGVVVTNADVSIIVPPSGRATRLVIAAAGNQTRRVTLTDDDFGGMLRATNAYDAITGGNLRIDAVYDDKQADHPLAGTAEMDEFQLGDAPTAARMLQLMTLYGVADLLHGPGLHFKRMIAPFRLANEKLDLLQARAYSASLGLTAQGTIDLPRNVFDMRGTIVPAYFFNSLLGRIPLIGKLFSPEPGGGVFAADFTLTGPIDNPQVHVNPLSLVTPGFLRGLFGSAPATTGK